MSLVRDYTDLLGNYDGHHANYDRLFSANPRAPLDELPDHPLAERFQVLASDPSQDEAVVRAHKGQSYVIQGPPGTGKSQTIANLLADCAARGKKVLFVCEKRVALDVVYHRLKEVNLQDLACLIHDTREDRKTFLADLQGDEYPYDVVTEVPASFEPERKLRTLHSDETVMCRHLRPVVRQ